MTGSNVLRFPNTDRASDMPGADRTLAARAGVGEQGAFETLWARHAPFVETAALLLTHQSHAAAATAEVAHGLRSELTAGWEPVEPVRVAAYRMLRDVVDAPSGHSEALKDSTTVRTFVGACVADQEMLWYAYVEPVGYAALSRYCGVRPPALLSTLRDARDRFRGAWVAEMACSRGSSSDCARHLRGRIRGRRSVELDAHERACLLCGLLQWDPGRIEQSLPLMLLPWVLGPEAMAWLRDGGR